MYAHVIEVLKQAREVAQAENQYESLPLTSFTLTGKKGLPVLSSHWRLLDELQLSLEVAQRDGAITETASEKAEQEKIVEGHFDAFWKEYPRHVARKAAFKAFKAAFKRETVAKIMAGLATYKRYCERKQKGAEFIAYPATWLNQDRWTDVLPGASSRAMPAEPEELTKDERALLEKYGE